ncbi:MAG: hypothetical protein SFX73_25390 [Kofleriaceae bacterium]|nr:hypothetical protein [Kofleriaceae bacterium]
MAKFQNGNPGGPGRPRGRIQKFREALGKLTGDGTEIAEGLAAIWRDPEADAKERLAAYELALAYLLGKPEQAVSVEAEVSTNTPQLDGVELVRRLPEHVIDAVLVEMDKGAPLALPPRTDG